MRHATEHELPPATPMASEVVAVIENEAPGLTVATPRLRAGAPQLRGDQ